jgi:hypothetical protein
MRNLMLALILTAAAGTDARAQSPAPTRYALVEVGGKALPTAIEKELRCREDVTAGTLSLSQDGRWLLETVTREICGDRTEEDSDRDHGTYTTEGQALRFLDEDGRESHDSGWGGMDDDLDEFKTGTMAADGSLTIKLADGTPLLFRKAS